MLTVATLVGLGACSGTQTSPVASTPKRGTSVLVIDNPTTTPRLTFGSLRLRMSQAEVLAQSQQPGWAAQGPVPKDGSVTLTAPTTDEAGHYGLWLEAGRVIQIAVSYRREDLSRAAMRHSYARSKIQSDGSWAMTDRLRATLVVLAKGGVGLVATDLSAARDRTGVRAMLERFLGE